MKKFLDVFQQPKKENSRTRYEKAFEEKFENKSKQIFLTEPEKAEFPQ